MRIIKIKDLLNPILEVKKPKMKPETFDTFNEVLQQIRKEKSFIKEVKSKRNYLNKNRITKKQPNYNKPCRR